MQDLPPDADFPDLPPFPHDVPTAPLLRLNLQRLFEGDEEERQGLFQACTELGFFYLDLRQANGNVTYQQGDNSNTNVSVSGDEYLQHAYSLFQAADDFFALPVAEKARYDFKDQGSYFGYKGYGGSVVDHNGTTDRNEFFNTSKDDIIGLGPSMPCPEVMTGHKPLLKEFITISHAIVTFILEALTDLLHLPPSSRLPHLHKLTTASGDQVRFVRSPPQPAQDRRTALGAHTDFGSVTLLFNRLGGLQVLPPGKNMEGGDESWLYVRPLPGHCVVNLGDALVKMTRGILRSNTHRVVNPPGEEQGALVRTSLVYFSRPNDEVLLKPLQGSDLIDDRKTNEEHDDKEAITAKDWTLRRALGRRGVGKFQDSRGTESTFSANGQVQSVKA